MTAFINIKSGQWVLAFQQPFGPYVREMPDVLESYAVKHWMDSFSKDEIFFIAPVETVKPKTFTTIEPVPYEGNRIPRCQVIAACRSKEAAIERVRSRLIKAGFRYQSDLGWHKTSTCLRNDKSERLGTRSC